MDIVTLGAALNGSKAYTDQVTQSLMGGVHYRGSVSYYSDLPNDAAEGDSYTVKYAGTSGTVSDGTEYTWGYDTDSQDFAWISFSKDTYSKAEIDNKLVGSNIALTGYTKGTTAKQDVSPTDNVNQGLGKIEKRVSDNENNILLSEQMNGAKNIVNIQDEYFNRGTTKINGDNGTITLEINNSAWTTYRATFVTQAVDYKLIFYVDSLTKNVQFFVQRMSDSHNYIGNEIKGTGISIFDFTSTGGNTLVNLNLENEGTPTTANITLRCMIIPKSIYDAGFTDYQPYAMSNAELTAATAQNSEDISSEQAKTTGMTEGGSNYITVNGIRVYVSATAPTGARTGDLWIGG